MLWFQGCILRFHVTWELTYPLTMIFLTSQGGGVKRERPKKPWNWRSWLGSRVPRSGVWRWRNWWNVKGCLMFLFLGFLSHMEGIHLMEFAYDMWFWSIMIELRSWWKSLFFRRILQGWTTKSLCELESSTVREIALSCSPIKYSTCCF